VARVGTRTRGGDRRPLARRGGRLHRDGHRRRATARNAPRGLAGGCASRRARACAHRRAALARRHLRHGRRPGPPRDDPRHRRAPHRHDADPLEQPSSDRDPESRRPAPVERFDDTARAGGGRHDRRVGRKRDARGGRRDRGRAERVEHARGPGDDQGDRHRHRHARRPGAVDHRAAARRADAARVARRPDRDDRRLARQGRRRSGRRRRRLRIRGRRRLAPPARRFRRAAAPPPGRPPHGPRSCTRSTAGRSPGSAGRSCAAGPRRRTRRSRRSSPPTARS
jgi:hypothetical protein